MTDWLAVDSSTSSSGCVRATNTPDDVMATAPVLPTPRSTGVGWPGDGDGVIDGVAATLFGASMPCGDSEGGSHTGNDDDCRERTGDADDALPALVGTLPHVLVHPRFWLKPVTRVSQRLPQQLLDVRHVDASSFCTIRRRCSNPLAAWLFTVPRLQPSTSAMSASERSS